MLARLFGALVLIGGLAGANRADDKPLDRVELDRRLVKTVYETALVGTDVFNKGKHDECFRLYQGTLVAIHPLLDHRPKLMAAVKGRIEKAARMKAADGAFELRAALDEIQNDIAPGAKVVPAQTTLWDRLGGEPGVKKAVHDIVLSAVEDKAVNFLRNGTVKLDAKGVAHLEQMMVEMLSAATGGPLKYTGKDMKTAHAGMKITEAEFNALGGIVSETLKKHNVAEADIKEVMGIIQTTKKDIVEGPKN